MLVAASPHDDIAGYTLVSGGCGSLPGGGGRRGLELSTGIGCGFESLDFSDDGVDLAWVGRGERFPFGGPGF